MRVMPPVTPELRRAHRYATQARQTDDAILAWVEAHLQADLERLEALGRWIHELAERDHKSP